MNGPDLGDRRCGAREPFLLPLNFLIIQPRHTIGSYLPIRQSIEAIPAQIVPRIQGDMIPGIP
jgi:hypothetical protein